MDTQPLIRRKILVKSSTIAGYGVFAEEDFFEDDIIEECYPLKGGNEDSAFINYFFSNGESSYLPLGYGCIYNHSQYNNAGWFFDEERVLFVYVAKRRIKKGEEIFVSYGNRWFAKRNIKMKERKIVHLYLSLLKLAPLGRFLIIASLLFAFVFWLKP